MKKKIKNALISVSDKDQLVSLLKILKKYKINIISSGGTFKSIIKMGFKCKEISEFTNFKEMLDALVSKYPKLEPQIKRGVSVAIDGVIYKESWFTPINNGNEVVLMPYMEGG